MSTHFCDPIIDSRRLVPFKRTVTDLRTASVMVVLFLLVHPTVVHGQSQFDDVELVVGIHGLLPFVRNAGFDVSRGRLISDPQARQLRFENGSAVLFAVAFDLLSALHYEESKYPTRALRRAATPYLTIHYVKAGGEPAFAILRLSRDSAPQVVESLERDTGLRVNRSAPTMSFPGLPIHLTPGRLVYVTDSAGQKTRGEVTRVSSASIDLGTSGRFEGASLRRIDVIDPIWDGAALGAVLFLLPAGVVSLSECYGGSCAGLGPLTVAGWGVIAVGGLVGALIDRNKMRNAYRRPEPGASSRVEWSPVFDDNRKAVRLSIRF